MLDAMPGTLVCTVGTSLEANLKRFRPDHFPDNLSEEDRAGLKQLGLEPDSAELHSAADLIENAATRRDWPALGRALTFLPPTMRLLGAEINSVAAMFHKKILRPPLDRLILLVSDTASGEQIGSTLRSYFLSAHSPLACSQVLLHTISGLQDADPARFQLEGLPNLIRMLGRQARQWSGSSMAINATGGYKAQIAFATVFGQAMSIPVYYKHELFNEIIAFPRVPFTMDLSLVQQNLRFWANVAEPDAVFTYEALKELGAPDSETWELMLPLLESVSEGGNRYYALSALGIIYWEAYCTRHPDLELEPTPATSNSGCRFRDDHFPKGFKVWAERVNQRFPFITGCHSLDYSGQRGMEFGFMEERGKIVGIYKDRTGFGARLEIMTTCSNALERKYALRVLNAPQFK